MEKGEGGNGEEKMKMNLGVGKAEKFTLSRYVCATDCLDNASDWLMHTVGPNVVHECITASGTKTGFGMFFFNLFL